MTDEQLYTSTDGFHQSGFFSVIRQKKKAFSHVKTIDLRNYWRDP